LQEAQAGLSHVTRVTTMGELAAAIAHEVTNPSLQSVTNANFCLRQLANATRTRQIARGNLGNCECRHTGERRHFRIRALLQIEPPSELQ